MEERKEMNYYVLESSTKDVCNWYLIQNNEICYIGHEENVDGETLLTFYLASISEYKSLLFLYIGDNTFDDLYNSIDRHSYKAYMNTWPLLIEALRRGENDDYSKIALIKLPSIVEGESFWCSAVLCENIDYSNIYSDYLTDKLYHLINDTNKMLIEYKNNDVSTFDKVLSIASVAFDGFRRGRMVKNISDILLGD